MHVFFLRKHALVSPSVIKINSIHESQSTPCEIHCWVLEWRSGLCILLQASTDKSSFKTVHLHYPYHLTIPIKGLIFQCFPQSGNWYLCKLLVNYSFWLKLSHVLALSVVETAAGSTRQWEGWDQIGRPTKHLCILYFSYEEITKNKPTSQKYFSAWGWQG